MIPLFLLLFTIPASLAQLPLPDPPFLPQDPEDGARPSDSLSVPNAQWSNLLGSGLYFYEAQRSGVLPDENRVPWRNTSATDDGEDVGLDLSGGYYDAGDYIKATFPLSFTLMSICWGAIDFGEGYNMANQTAYLDSMLRWGLDWLMKAHPSDNTLYVLVSDPNVDDDYWGGDQGIPTPRHSFKVDEESPGTDVAAAAAAAFASCSYLYSTDKISFGSPYGAPASLRDTDYGDTLLSHAKALYNFAYHSEKGLYHESVPEIAGSYASSGYEDELTVAALWLALASNSSEIYQEAEDMYTQRHLAEQYLDRLLNWDSKGPAIPILFSQVARLWERDSKKWNDESERYLNRILNQEGDTYWKTPAGLLYYEGESDYDSINPALNAAMLFARYAPIASSDEMKDKFQDFADEQFSYALGRNPMSVPYIVGVNPNSPSNPHSAPASGGNDLDSINEGETAHILHGGVIGGPDRYDNYYDIRNDWPQTEVAIDYTAPLLALTAMHVISDESDPYYTRLAAGEYDKVRPEGIPCDPAYPCSPTGHHLPKGGKIAIGVVVSAVGVMILGGCVWYVWLMRRSKGKHI